MANIEGSDEARETVQAHQWHREALLRVLLLLCTVIGLVLSSGAPSNWF